MARSVPAEKNPVEQRSKPRLVFQPAVKTCLMTSIAVVLAACATQPVYKAGRTLDPKYGVYASPRVTTDERISPDVGRNGRSMVGRPYLVAGKRYVPRADPTYVAVGAASWYGTDFHGRKTANGEVFDMNDITAAHPTMPLPSYARVTNVANGTSIVVRINDRGPYHGNRVIDVSKHAAELLAFKDDGVGKVKVEYLGPAQASGSDEQMLMATLRTDGTPAPKPSFLGDTMMAQAAPVPPVDVPLPPPVPVELAAYQPPAVETAAPVETTAFAPEPPVVHALALPPSRPVQAGMEEMGDDFDTTPFVAPSAKPKAKAKATVIPLPPERQASADILVPLSPIRLGVADIVGTAMAPLAYADQVAGAQIEVAPAKNYVDAGYFADHAQAEKLMWLLSSTGNVEMAATMQGGQRVWHVRSGPYVAEADARAVVTMLRVAGAGGAAVIH